MAKKNRKRLKHGTRDLAKPRASVSLSQPTWDQGATGPANRVGLVSEPRGEVDPDTGKLRNPNSVHGVRRQDMLEVYHRHGWITDRGYTAGEALRDAWAATQRGRGMDWSMERVDSSPKPDAAIDIQVDRASRYAQITGRIASGDRAILLAVVAQGHPVQSLVRYRGSRVTAGRDHLRAALDRLAERLGM